MEITYRAHKKTDTDPPPPNPTKTNFTGHYATISHSQRSNYKTRTVGGYDLWRPNLVGLQVRIGWSECEPTKSTSVVFGNAGYHYDFSLLDSFLDECANGGHACSGANGAVQVLLLLEDKSFEDTTATPPGHDYFPTYLYTETGPGTGQSGAGGAPCGGYTSPHSTGGSLGTSGDPSVVFRWDTYVATRYDKLIQGLKNWRSSVVPNGYDAHPNFEGIVIQESSLGISVGAATLDPTYSAVKYVAGIEAWLASINTQLTKCRGFWFFNFLDSGQTQMDNVLAWMVTNTPDCSGGGPDCLHGRNSLNSVSGPYGAYQLYTKYKGQLDMAASMQNDSYRETVGGTGMDSGPPYYTMEQQFQLAIGGSIGGVPETTSTHGWQLFADRVFWDFRGAGNPVGSRDWSDAAQVIDAHGSFNSTATKKS